MADRFNNELRALDQGAGDNSTTWGERHDDENHALIFKAIAGYEAVDVSGSSDVTLTTADGADNQWVKGILKFTGTLTGNINVIVPARSKHWVIWNATSGSFTLTVKTASGTGKAVEQGTKTILFCDGTNVEKVLEGAKLVGKETIFIPAVAMSPASTNGASANQAELTAGQPELRCLDFDASSAEYAQFDIAFPLSWNESTVTYQVFWTANSTSTNSVVWGLQGVAISDNDAIATAYGTAVTVTDANGSTANTLRVSAESSAITVAGSPAAGDMCFFRIYRDAASGSDTLATDARLIGIKLFFTTNASNDE